MDSAAIRTELFGRRCICASFEPSDKLSAIGEVLEDREKTGKGTSVLTSKFRY